MRLLLDQPSRRGTVSTFSPIVWWGNRPDCWITYPIPRRRSVTFRVAASTPSIRILPDVGSMSRLTILSEVVLPQPDGPTSTQIRPAGTVSERSLTAPGVPCFEACP